jgi:pyruvate-formate lyase-activating enzyme
MQNSSKQSTVREHMKENRVAELSTTPPWPKHVNVELGNVCNHRCVFCAYSLMERTKGNIKVEQLKKWLNEAHELGSRILGLHAGAEPFASPHLEYFTKYAKEIGYEYVYISTNGSLAVPERMKKVVDAQMDSIKFSINAGDRETYRKIHGRDHFERVIEHLRFAKEYRAKRKKPYLSVSFVIVGDNAHTLDKLKNITANLVDEFISFKASNGNGQLPGVGGPSAFLNNNVCAIPFNKLYISWEGFLRVCCNDYENLLAIADLNEVSLKDAYYSQEFMDFRRRHLDDRLEGTLCYNCKYNCQSPIQPLNPRLYFATHKSDKGPAISDSSKIFKTWTDPATTRH